MCFTTRCYGISRHRVTLMSVCPLSVCLSVCLSDNPSHASIVSKQLNAESCKQCHTIAQGLYFSEAKGLNEIQTGSHNGSVR